MVLWVSGGANRDVSVIWIYYEHVLLCCFFCTGGEHIIWLSDYFVYHDKSCQLEYSLIYF